MSPETGPGDEPTFERVGEDAGERTLKHLPTILAVLGGILVAMPVFANTDGGPRDQIIVTGARAPISAGDIGSAVTIITRDDIERRQARYVSDLLRAVPGFAVSHTGVVGSQTQVRVRGSEANQVLVLIDGVRVNDPATGDEFRWEFLATTNIERIEIVRGPQSALWGSDAIGGVVHIITRSGGAARKLRAYVEGGSRNTLNAAMSGGIGGDNWSLGFGVEELTTDGSNISRSGNEKDEADLTTASLHAQFRPSAVLTIQLGARTVDAYSQFDAIDFFVTGLPADSDVATNATQNSGQLGVTVGTTGSRVRHRLTARYFGSDNRELTDGSKDGASQSDRVTLGYQADIAMGRNLLSLALEHEKTEFRQRGPVGFGDPNQDQAMRSTSAIVDFQGHATESVSWLASVRFDDNSDFGNILTGRGSLAWDIAAKTTLRASIGTGQKAPTFIERFGFFPAQFIGNPGLDPERSLSYDVGIEQQLGETASLQVTVFRQDLRDEINGFAFDAAALLFTAENLDTKSKRTGLELGVHWDAADSLGISLNYTYTDASENGTRELRRPRHAGSVQADYGFHDGRGHLSLTADYGGTRLDTFFPPWPATPETVMLDDYWLVDLAVQYAVTEALQLFARASNLLDTGYEQVYGYRTPGRALYAGARVRFGAR